MTTQTEQTSITATAAADTRTMIKVETIKRNVITHTYFVEPSIHDVDKPIGYVWVDMFRYVTFRFTVVAYEAIRLGGRVG